MLIISYTLSFIATVLGIIEPFGKKMRDVLILNFLGNALVGISYLLVSQKSGAIICFVACVQVIINYCFDKKEKKIPAWIIGLYAIAFIVANIFVFAAWYDLFAFAASMLYVLSVAQNNPKFYRVLYMSNSAVWIAYDVFAKAYGNLTTHIVLFIATITAIIVRDKLKKRRE